MVDFYEAAFAVLKSDVDSGLLYEEDASIVNDILYTKYATFSENGPVLVKSVESVEDVVDKTVFGAVAKSGKLRKRLKAIKNAKPDEFDNDKDAKEFVDKHYDELMSAAKYLEKEPEDITESVFKALVASAIGLIGFAIGTASLTPAGLFIGSAAYMVSVAMMITNYILNVVRANKDFHGFKDIGKISTALKKLKSKKGLSEDYQKRIQKLINAIEDAQAEVSPKVTVKKESAEITEEDVDSMRLRVYEAVEEGAITDDDKHMMLEMLNLENYE